ncbi:transcription factor IIA alpha/beta subunit [Trametes versicolor FP-101664 SS1]|uniref:transcription factor IIA alpha/beta subunit n=1 Tax=Trametes versicolor (strain FP-101664) TaxID=717944 RepID=UPI00046240CE|nr:transcription factor IIA alpha/beta subunit [Trametes versicolor FP-101664 SS1]EIW62804.1 transcription factor IIA alpha/beta subunit [Trametes versicolor FP-101664 SS1]
MSNKIVPSIYRAVIDDVISNIKSEFDEYGVSEDVLAELQSKWEAKVIASHVADFEPAPAPQPPAPPAHSAYPPHPIHMQHGHYPPHTAYAQPHHTHVKTEPVDTRYMLSNPVQYGLPPLAGPQIPTRPPLPGGQPMSYTHMNGRPPSAAGQAPPPPTARYAPPANPAQPAPAARIPQVDGPSSSESESPSPPPSQSYAPRTSHPSLPQPSQTSAAEKAEDSEAINSDLDDSDSDVEQDGIEGGSADQDIVFCTYDKVARVKNKWKCVLKDGMIHINGKDYLFAKCSGEFEW